MIEWNNNVEFSTVLIQETCSEELQYELLCGFVMKAIYLQQIYAKNVTK